MPRVLFEKVGNAVWISHLDLMRLFQRAFKRAGLPLKHSQGFNPRPYVAVALPLSVGVESHCELLDFDLDGDPVSCDEIRDRLNGALVDGIRVLEVYEEGVKIKHLALLDCTVSLEYDRGVPSGSVERIRDLFQKPELTVMKKSKNGPVEQDIIPMIRRLEITQTTGRSVTMRALVCCQNPSLNPMQLSAAVSKHLPELTPDHVVSCRIGLYDAQMKAFR